MEQIRVKKCELCRCSEIYDFHHFIPRTLHSNKWFKKRYTRQELSKGIDVCKECHNTLHDLIPDEKEMGKKYNTLDKLLNHDKVAKYVKWKRTKATSL